MEGITKNSIRSKKTSTSSQEVWPYLPRTKRDIKNVLEVLLQAQQEQQNENWISEWEQDLEVELLHSDASIKGPITILELWKTI